MPVIIDGSQGITFPDNSRQYNGYFGFKNRIINGQMQIDQRNNGAAVTPTDGQFIVDRFQFYRSSGTFSAQRSTTAPAGFINSLQFTVSSVATRTAADYIFAQQNIEGLNLSDMAFGTANAISFTISFWARSSVTGLYSGVCNSSDNTRSYPFTYTINSANTFEFKTVTIPGDTSGTWLTTNGIGMYVRFDLGSGANYQATAGSGWQALTNRAGASGTVGWAQTNGATFYITGVQLEEGGVSTNFDVLPYGTQLQLCQRYCQIIVGSNTGAGYFASGTNNGTAQARGMISLKTTMRAAPSMSFASAASFLVQAGSSTYTPSAVGQIATSVDSASMFATISGATNGQGCLIADNTSAATLVTLTSEL